MGPGREGLTTPADAASAPRAPDGTARPVRIARAARDAPGQLRIACSQAEIPSGPEVSSGSEANSRSTAAGGDSVEPAQYTITCLAHLGVETLAAASVQVGRAPEAHAAESHTAESHPDAEGGARRTITLARGDCATCPLAIQAPGTNGALQDVPAQSVPERIRATVARAEELLVRSHAGAPEGAGPLFEVREAPRAEEPQGAEPGKRRRRKQPQAEAGVSRRDLLFAGIRGAEQDAHDLTVPAPNPERGVLLAALPSAVVEHPVAAPGCTGCRICEQVCPEKAFGWSGIGSNGLLWVSPADCTACGICVQACPEDVLDLEAVTAADSAHRLARIQPRGCGKCGRGLSPGEREVCTACTSRRSLLDDVWKHIGG